MSSCSHPLALDPVPKPNNALHTGSVIVEAREREVSMGEGVSGGDSVSGRQKRHRYERRGERLGSRE